MKKQPKLTTFVKKDGSIELLDNIDNIVDDKNQAKPSTKSDSDMTISSYELYCYNNSFFRGDEEKIYDTSIYAFNNIFKYTKNDIMSSRNPKGVNSFIFFASQKASTDKYKKNEIRVIFFEKSKQEGQAIMYEIDLTKLKLSVEDIGKYMKWESNANSAMVLIY